MKIHPGNSAIVLLRLMSGAGNRFTVFDNRAAQIPAGILADAAPALCRAPFADGLRTEGLITLEAADGDGIFAAEFFNPDGSHGAMCGNGGRCAVNFARSSAAIVAEHHIGFTMAGAEYTARLTPNGVEVRFLPAREIIENVEITAHGALISATYINVGSDHAVVFYDDLRLIFPALPDDLRRFDLAGFAPAIRRHERFAPRGVNVNVAQINPENWNSLLLRTFERGVEAETGACGTGALSSAIAAVLRGIIRPPVTVIPSSGRVLTVGMEDDSPRGELTLEGDAEMHDAVRAEIFPDGTAVFSAEM